MLAQFEPDNPIDQGLPITGNADIARLAPDLPGRGGQHGPVLDLALQVDTSFWGEASCAIDDGVNAHLFFSEELTDIATAKRICAGCPVLEQCLEGALARKEPLGVWGGQLFSNGKILVAKRRRGRPPKHARPEDEFVQVAVPEALRPQVERRIAAVA